MYSFILCLKSLFHYALGLRFGNLKRSKTYENRNQLVFLLKELCYIEVFSGFGPALDIFSRFFSRFSRLFACVLDLFSTVIFFQLHLVKLMYTLQRFQYFKQYIYI